MVDKLFVHAQRAPLATQSSYEWSLNFRVAVRSLFIMKRHEIGQSRHRWWRCQTKWLSATRSDNQRTYKTNQICCVHRVNRSRIIQNTIRCGFEVVSISSHFHSFERTNKSKICVGKVDVVVIAFKMRWRHSLPMMIFHLALLTRTLSWQFFLLNWSEVETFLRASWTLRKRHVNQSLQCEPCTIPTRTYLEISVTKSGESRELKSLMSFDRTQKCTKTIESHKSALAGDASMETFDMDRHLFG